MRFSAINSTAWVAAERSCNLRRNATRLSDMPSGRAPASPDYTHFLHALVLSYPPVTLTTEFSK
jgi:hypothetical protein